MAAPDLWHIGISRRWQAFVLMSMVVTVLVGFCSGLLGSLGMGAGAVLLVYLRVFGGMEQMQAQGTNLLFFLPIAAFSLILHSRKGLVDWKAALWCALAGIPTVFVGVWLANVLGGKWLSKLFAGLLIYIGIRELFIKKPQDKPEETQTETEKEV